MLRKRGPVVAVKTLCEAGCPEALAVREASKLATAAKELGWQAPDSASIAQANAAPRLISSVA